MTSWKTISTRWKDYILVLASDKLVRILQHELIQSTQLGIKDLQQDYRSFGMSIQGLAGLETGIAQQLHGFSEAVLSYVKAMSEMVSGEWHLLG